jgi:hypothetical protein
MSAIIVVAVVPCSLLRLLSNRLVGQGENQFHLSQSVPAIVIIIVIIAIAPLWFALCSASATTIRRLHWMPMPLEY